MTDRNPRVTEEEAARLWRRAAELQAAADRSGAERALPAAEPAALSLADVTAAAEGAGIDPDYVRLSLAEGRLPDAHAIEHDRWTGRWYRRLVAGAADAIEVSRRIDAPPDRVMDALQSVGCRPPYDLTLEDQLGDDPVRDGVLVYRLAGQGTPFTTALDFADVRVLLVTVRAEGEGTRLRARAPLFRRGINVTLSGVSAGLLGGGGAWGGWSLGGVAAGAIGGGATAVLLVPAAVAAVAGGFGGLALYRSMFHGIVRSGRAALSKLLGAVALAAEGRADALPPPASGQDSA